MEPGETLVERLLVPLALSVAWIAICAVSVVVTIVVCEFQRVRGWFSTLMVRSRKVFMAPFRPGR
jgi:hypothetical protein